MYITLCQILLIFTFEKRIIVHLNETTGLIQSISTDGEKIELEQEFFWYASRKPLWKAFIRNHTRLGSGAYVFRPNQTNPFPIRATERVSVSIYKG